MHSTTAGRRISRFCAETGIGRTKLLTLPHELRPDSVLVGRSRIILEDPAAWLVRVGTAKRGGSLYRLLDRRQDGTSRIVATFDDPAEARAAFDALRRAGDTSAELEVVAALDPLTGEAMR